MDVKEQSIVQKLRNGDQGAYRYLYDRHYVVLCQFANELVGDPFLAETIVGDVIFHLWEIRETEIPSSVAISSFFLCSKRLFLKTRLHSSPKLSIDFMISFSN